MSSAASPTYGAIVGGDSKGTYASVCGGATAPSSWTGTPIAADLAVYNTTCANWMKWYRTWAKMNYIQAGGAGLDDTQHGQIKDFMKDWDNVLYPCNTGNCQTATGIGSS